MVVLEAMTTWAGEDGIDLESDGPSSIHADFDGVSITLNEEESKRRSAVTAEVEIVVFEEIAAAVVERTAGTPIGLMHLAMEDSDAGLRFVASATMHREGLIKQGFLSAVVDVSRTASGLDREQHNAQRIEMRLAKLGRGGDPLSARLVWRRHRPDQSRHTRCLALNSGLQYAGRVSAARDAVGGGRDAQGAAWRFGGCGLTARCHDGRCARFSRTGYDCQQCSERHLLLRDLQVQPRQGSVHEYDCESLELVGIHCVRKLRCHKRRREVEIAIYGCIQRHDRREGLWMGIPGLAR